MNPGTRCMIQDEVTDDGVATKEVALLLIYHHFLDRKKGSIFIIKLITKHKNDNMATGNNPPCWRYVTALCIILSDG